MDKKIEFELDGYFYIVEKFDKKNNLIYVKKYDTKKNFIGNDKLKTGLLPKKIKQKLNPLK